MNAQEPPAKRPHLLTEIPHSIETPLEPDDFRAELDSCEIQMRRAIECFKETSGPQKLTSLAVSQQGELLLLLLQGIGTASKARFAAAAHTISSIDEIKAKLTRLSEEDIPTAALRLWEEVILGIGICSDCTLPLEWKVRDELFSWNAHDEADRDRKYKQALRVKIRADATQQARRYLNETILECLEGRIEREEEEFAATWPIAGCDAAARARRRSVVEMPLAIAAQLGDSAPAKTPTMTLASGSIPSNDEAEKTFGEWFQQQLKRFGLSPSNVANRSKGRVTRQHIDRLQHVVRFKRGPNPETLKIIAEATGIDHDELLHQAEAATKRDVDTQGRGRAAPAPEQGK